MLISIKRAFIFLLILKPLVVIADDFNLPTNTFIDCLVENFDKTEILEKAQNTCQEKVNKAFPKHTYKIEISKLKSKYSTVLNVEIKTSEGDKHRFAEVSLGRGKIIDCEIHHVEEKVLITQANDIEAFQFRKEMDELNEKYGTCYPSDMPLSNWQSGSGMMGRGASNPISMGYPIGITGMGPGLKMSGASSLINRRSQDSTPVTTFNYGYGYKKSKDGGCEKRCLTKGEIYENDKCIPCEKSLGMAGYHLTNAALKKYSAKNNSNTCTDSNGCPPGTEFIGYNSIDGKPKCMPSCGFGYSRNGEKCDLDPDYCDEQLENFQAPHIDWTYINEAATINVGTCHGNISQLANEFRSTFDQRLSRAEDSCDMSLMRFIGITKKAEISNQPLPYSSRDFGAPSFSDFLEDRCGTKDAEGNITLIDEDSDKIIYLRIPAYNQVIY